MPPKDQVPDPEEKSLDLTHAVVRRGFVIFGMLFQTQTTTAFLNKLTDYLVYLVEKKKDQSTIYLQQFPDIQLKHQHWSLTVKDMLEIRTVIRIHQ